MILWFFAAFFLVFSCTPLPVSADVRVRVLRQAAQTSTGNQDFTISGFGTPKGAIVLMNYAIADATTANTAGWSAGFTDCTAQSVVHVQDRADGLTTSDTNRRAGTAAVAELLEAATAEGTTLDGIGSASCITDGIRINWTTAMSAGFFVHIVLFGGSDMQVKVGQFDQNPTVNASVDITDVGFVPEGVFCLTIGQSAAKWDNSAGTEARFGFGVASPTAQGSVAWSAGDALTTTSYGGGTSALYACNAPTVADFLDSVVELGSFDAQGFTATTRDETHTHQFTYLAYTTGGKARSWAGELAAPATPQAQSYTAPGWRPQAYIMFLTGAATVNTELTADDAAQFGFGIGDATAQYALMTRGDDNMSPVDVGSRSDAAAVRIMGATGTARWVATLTGFTATGWDLNFTTSAAVAAWYGWAMEESPRPRGRPLWFQ